MAASPFSDFNFQSAINQINANPYASGWGSSPSLSDPSYTPTKPSAYYWNPSGSNVTPGQGSAGYWVMPQEGQNIMGVQSGGGYRVAPATWTPDGRPGNYAGAAYGDYDTSGNYTGSGTWGSNVVPDDESWKQFGIAGSMMLGGFGAAIGGLGATAAGAASSGAGGAGAAGMAGDATAAGYGGLSAADAAAMGGGASIPGAAGAGGAGFLGDATAAGYGGLDAASTATMGGGASLSGAGEAAGATGLAGAGGGPGVTPPNPYYSAPSTGGLSSLGGVGSAGGTLGSLATSIGGQAVSGLIGSALAGGTGTSGGQASAYIPTARPQFDQNFQNYYGQYGTTLGNIQGQTAPASQQVFNGQFNNPYAPGFQAAAGQAGQMYGQQAGQAQGAANTLYGAGNQLYQMAFDPRGAQYQQNLQQLTDNTRAAEYARGVASSPYGAAVESNSLGQFQNDWQNQQLQRAESGLSAANSAYSGGATMGNTAGAMQLASGQTPYDASNAVYGNQSNAISNYWGANSPYFTGNNQLQSNALSYVNGANQAANMGFNQNQTNNQNAYNIAQSISGPVSNAISSGLGNMFGNGYTSSAYNGSSYGTPFNDGSTYGMYY